MDYFHLFPLLCLFYCRLNFWRPPIFIQRQVESPEMIFSNSHMIMIDHVFFSQKCGMPLVVKIGNMWFEKMLDWGCSIFINFQPHPIFLYKTSHRNSLVTSLEHAFFTAGYPLICFRFLRFPLVSFGFLWFPLMFFDFLCFGAGWIL